MTTMNNDENTFVVENEYNGERIDNYLTLNTDKTRNHLQKLIKDGFVLLNDKEISVSKKVKTGDKIVITERENEITDIVPQNIPIDIVYEDEYLAVINKPQNMVVHPGSGVSDGTLVNALLYHLDSLSGINGVIRPGIVHRIDKNTSGLLVVAKNDFAHNILAKQIQDKVCKRIYVALTECVMGTDEGIIDKPIGRNKTDRKKMDIDYQNGRNAVTCYRVLERFNNNTLVRCELKTGRTHQIRVHLKNLGYPIVGDNEYGYKKQRFNLNGQLLHASKLSFYHPKTNEYMSFTAVLPDAFKKVLKILRNEKNKK